MLHHQVVGLKRKELCVGVTVNRIFWGVYYELASTCGLFSHRFQNLPETWYVKWTWFCTFLSRSPQPFSLFQVLTRTHAHTQTHKTTKQQKQFARETKVKKKHPLRLFCSFPTMPHYMTCLITRIKSNANFYWAQLEPRKRQWHPTPVFLSGKSHGRRSLVGCSPWGHEKSDTTEQLLFHFSLSCTGEGNGNELQYSFFFFY